MSNVYRFVFGLEVFENVSLPRFSGRLSAIYRDDGPEPPVAPGEATDHPRPQKGREGAKN